MSWFYEAWSLPSEKNGKIDCIRVMGRWNVSVQGCNESSDYIYDLWKDALRRVPPSAPIKRVLMLGLAAGSSIELLHRRFPGCRVTAVEWDPVMVEVMDRLRLFRPPHRPKILLGDAAKIVPDLHEKFDLIIFDLYQGPLTPGDAKTQNFFEALRPLLSRDGYLLVNAYEQKGILQTASACFSEQVSWKYRFNLASLYKPFGTGTKGDPLPSGYAQFRSNVEYLRRDITSEKNASLVEAAGVPGVRRWMGPFCIEKYYGDAEPVLDGQGPKRLVIWQRTRRLDMPAGWGRSSVQMNAEITGFVDLAATKDPLADWSPHAQRHLKHWLAQEDDWEAVEPSLEAFLGAFKACGMKRSLKELFRHTLLQKAAAHGSRLRLVALKRRSSGLIEAGLAVLDVPELNESVHIASFVHDSAKHNDAGTGLISLWFKDAENRKIRFLELDLFRGPSDPRSWEGFSRFKSQFGTSFVRYPRPLTRWVGTWKGWTEHLVTQIL